MHLGYFDQEGLELERLVSPSSAQMTAGIASGSINSGASLPDGFVRAVEQGAPVTIIASEMSTVIYSLMAPSSIQDFADVRGKPVGTSEPRGATTLIMRKLFGLAGLGEQDYDLVVVGGTRERYTALKAGTIYAGLLAQPQDFQLADEGFRRLALSTSALKPYVVGAIAANPDWMRQNEARTVRYLRAVIRSARWLTDPANKEAAIRILMDETKAEERYARLTYALYLEEEQVIPPEAEMDPRSLDTVLDLMVEANDLPSPRPAASKYIDPSYRERARGTLEAAGR
jgi:NitT/TauT family transport system substrate-binding protein